MEHLGLHQGPLPEWLRDTHEASETEGRRRIDFCIEGWARELSSSR
ncbi:hypothetical protein JOC55_003721 [Paenibacillus sacheonensis]|nr:hypothetical protein [Paenibacillus sacheonensis]